MGLLVSQASHTRWICDIIVMALARLDEQLAALEGKLREADGHVQHLLGHSTALWLGDGSAAPGQEHAFAQNGSNGTVERSNTEQQSEQGGAAS